LLSVKYSLQQSSGKKRCYTLSSRNRHRKTVSLVFLDDVVFGVLQVRVVGVGGGGSRLLAAPLAAAAPPAAAAAAAAGGGALHRRRHRRVHDGGRAERRQRLTWVHQQRLGVLKRLRQRRRRGRPVVVGRRHRVRPRIVFTLYQQSMFFFSLITKSSTLLFLIRDFVIYFNNSNGIKL
jgi:hypothetical protein